MQDAKLIIAAGLLSLASFTAGFLIAYHPHPFGWGKAQVSGGGGYRGGGYDLSTP
jgi:hypothetical protein